MPTIPENVCELFENESPVFIEIDVAEKSQASFENDYFEWTGERPIVGDGYFTTTDKWGKEFRVYFNDDEIANQLRTNGYNPYKPSAFKEEFEYRVDNNDLVQYLIENCGLRIGENL